MPTDNTVSVSAKAICPNCGACFDDVSYYYHIGIKGKQGILCKCGAVMPMTVIKEFKGDDLFTKDKEGQDTLNIAELEGKLGLNVIREDIKKIMKRMDELASLTMQALKKH